MADGLPAMRLKDIVRIDNARAVGLPSNSRMEPSTARASTNEGSNIIWFRLTCEVARFCMCSQSHFQRSRKEGSAFISGVISDQSARIGSGASGWGSRYQPIHLELAGGDGRPAIRLRSLLPNLLTNR